MAGPSERLVGWSSGQSDSGCVVLPLTVQASTVTNPLLIIGAGRLDGQTLTDSTCARPPQ